MSGSPVRNLKCSSCTGRAGRFQQWWNRDHGYGICRKCIETLLRDGRETPAEIREQYGVEGIHYALPRLGMTLGEYLAAVNGASQDHYRILAESEPGLAATAPLRRLYVEADVTAHWENGAWPDEAFSVLYSTNVSEEHLQALGLKTPAAQA